MIQNLNDENFFNLLCDIAPDAVKHFDEWFEEYKKEIDWDRLFGDRIWAEKPTKFTRLPFEMQNGILARFELELFHNAGGRGKETYEMIAKQYQGQARSLFAELQKRIVLFRQGTRS